MALTAYLRNPGNVRKYAQGHLYLAERTADGTGLSWQRFEAIRGTGQPTEADTEEVKDDSGGVYAHTSTVVSDKLTFDILARDERVRHMFMRKHADSVLGKRYCLCYVGADIISTADGATPDAMEVLAAQEARFSMSKDYAIGDDGMISGIEVTLLENTGGDYTVILPSTESEWPVTGTHASLAVVTGESYVTEDLSMS